MAVPQQKRSKAKTRSKRAANMRKSMPGISYCGNCESPKPPHRVCPTCGHFDARRGRIVETEFAGTVEE
jgi:large subunit ribosomal protein L32